jgi:hypothetical protein
MSMVPQSFPVPSAELPSTCSPAWSRREVGGDPRLPVDDGTLFWSATSRALTALFGARKSLIRTPPTSCAAAGWPGKTADIIPRQSRALPGQQRHDVRHVVAMLAPGAAWSSTAMPATMRPIG